MSPTTGLYAGSPAAPETSDLERLPTWEQVAALAYAGNAYGLLDRCGVSSTHRESALLDRLHEGGYELVRRAAATPAPPVDVAKLRSIAS